jgi:hypothetical protein
MSIATLALFRPLWHALALRRCYFAVSPLFPRLLRRRESRIPAAKEGLPLIICGKNSRKQRKTAVFGSRTAEITSPISGARGKQASADRDVVDQAGAAETDCGEHARGCRDGCGDRG